MADDDEAPWLAAAPAPPAGKRSLTVRIIIGLAVAAVLAIIIVFILLRPGGSSSEGYMEADQAPLIAAEPGPYKVRPDDPRGLDVEGQGDTMYAAGAGIEQTSDIDLGAAPEDPLPRPGTQGDSAGAAAEPPPPAKNLLPPAMQQGSAGASAPTSSGAVVAPPAPAKAVAPALAGVQSQVQLGAFSARGRAEAAWAGLVAKHGMAGLTPRFLSTTSDGKTLWRLRTATADPAALCARLKAAGDACSEVKP